MTWFLDLLNLEDSTPARVGLRIVGIALALLVDLAVFVYLFTRLPRLNTPLKRVFKGALLGAVGLEILKVVGSILVARTTANPVYGAFAVVVGLLIWINLVSRFVLFTAAWTVTAPYDTDVPPSGTADVESAREAGIPEQYADHDPDNPPQTAADGAPAPLAAALQGETPAQDQAEGRVDQRADRDRAGGEQVPVELQDADRLSQDDPYPRGRTPRPASRPARAESSSSGSRGDASDSAAIDLTSPDHPRLVPSEASLRTTNRVGAGVVLAGAATAALYGAKILRESRSDEG